MLSCSIVKCSTYCCAQGSIAKFRGSPDPLLIFVSCLNTNHGGLVTVRHLICSSYLHATGLKNILRLYRAVKITYLIERYRSSLYSPPHSVRNPFPAFVLRARRAVVFRLPISRWRRHEHLFVLTPAPSLAFGFSRDASLVL